MKPNSYKSLLSTVGVHFFIMYALTFAAVSAFSDVMPFNTRSLYMAIIMVSPMVILMLLFMKHMFENKRLNMLLYTGSIVLFVLFFTFIRQQILVGNEQFLRSMIPHHSGAINMCEKASIDDQEILDLCDSIIKSQKEEISQMKSILNRLNP